MSNPAIAIHPWSLDNPTPEVEAFLRRPAFDERAEAAAAKCLADIRARGLEAVLEACRTFDKAELSAETIRVTDAELDAAEAHGLGHLHLLLPGDLLPAACGKRYIHVLLPPQAFAASS